nr:hypothetical protein [Serratia marcescens]
MQPAMPAPLFTVHRLATNDEDAPAFCRVGCVTAHLTGGYLSSAFTRPLL